MSVRPPNAVYSYAQHVRDTLDHAAAWERAMPSHSVTNRQLHELQRRPCQPTAAAAKRNPKLDRLTALARDTKMHEVDASKRDTAELMLNTLLEDMEEELMAMTAIVTGQAGPEMPACPPKTTYSSLRVVKRLSEMSDRIRQIIELVEDLKPSERRFTGPGLYQMDAHIGA